MKIWFSTYQLVSQNLNLQIQKNKYRKGALLRIRFDDHATGYADLCPYPEMGDHPIEFELKQIATLKPTMIGECSIRFARWDAETRLQQKSIYSSDNKIKNHFLITDLLNFDLTRIPDIEISGYSEFKIKMGRDLIKETIALEQMTNRLRSGSKLRLDFNSSLNRDRFTDWFEKNQKWLRPYLDYIEDPFVYRAKDWREVSAKWNVPFALDLAADPVTTQAEGASIVVLKPARQNIADVIHSLNGKNKKFIFSHYMDFALGQMFAYATAQKWAPQLGRDLLTCGLQTQDLYSGMTFQDQIQNDGPYVIPPEGLGAGFDSKLNHLEWIELS